MKINHLILRIIGILAAILIAWQFRDHAARTLFIDYDEDDYLRAAQQYAQVFRSGNLSGLMQFNYRQEHPPLSKIVYGLSILSLPDEPLVPDRPTTAQPDQTLPKDQVQAARRTGVILGTLTAGLLALINPIAGIFLAIHSYTVKYDSQIMLEALPAFTSLLCVWAYTRWKKSKTEKMNAWLVLSAIALGLTASAKYLYCVAGIAVLIDWLILARKKHRLQNAIRMIAIWGALAVVVFFITDPYLWPDPITRLKESILYHAGYSTGAAEVEKANYPFWQPMVYLFSTTFFWQPDSIYLAIDPLITIFALIGLVSLWRDERVYALWIFVALLFLFIWPTKWPQYLIIYTAPLCLAAGKGISYVLSQKERSGPVGEATMERGAPQNRNALPWLLPGLIIFVLFTILPLIFQVGVSLTDFNSVSIKDGLNGGLFREIWGGITGAIKPLEFIFPSRQTQVHFTGLQTYLPVLNYVSSAGILTFDFFWTVSSVLLQTVLGAGIALLLWQRGVKFKQFWLVLFMIPWAIPEMIGARMWFNVFAPDTGWLYLATQAAQTTQVPFAFLLNWVSDPFINFLVLTISATWYGFPFIMLVTNASLKMLPPEVYDAAAIDGAGTWSTFRQITLPMLLPLIVPAMIIRGIFAFNQFYLFQAFFQGEGTLANTSYNFFNPSGYGVNGQFAISAVINIISILFLFVFVILLNRWSRSSEGVNYA